MYNGQAVSLNTLEPGLVELVFDLQGESVNKLNNQTLKELTEAVGQLAAATDIKGLLISSAKPAFIVGADITGFQENFALSSEELKAWINETHAVFATLESLPFPTVAAINGMALGGGFELALSADYRVLSADARVGLPEVNLGICPGWGGTVRLSRLIGAEAALQWMMTGKAQKASVALKQGAADSVAPPAELRDVAMAMLNSAVAGDIEFATARERKQQPLPDSPATRTELAATCQTYAKKLDPDYPAPVAILNAVCAHATLPLAEALAVEVDAFVTLAQSDSAKSLVGLFMNDQQLKKKSKAWSQQADSVKKSAVLGAGIMGGGVAFQSASTGTPIVMKDIREEALSLGLKTASGLLDRMIDKGRMDAAAKAVVMDAITPALDYSEFGCVDLVVEAVVENPAVKAAVLADVESAVPETAVLASNTSTISIDTLAENLARPEQLCGMHFFNPVHLMPLVEVIRGSKTSDQTVARTVAYATAMGKTPIVVNDCPGFLVNRILFPYFNAFNRLLIDGVDFQRIDRVMEAFGWPMGPAYLADVVGIDTLVHADHVMQQGFPQRMGHDTDVIAEALLAADCLGQKNGKGFYEYGADENGRRFKEPAGLVRELISERSKRCIDISDQEIIDRMMIPLCLESVRCLEDGIVESAAEVDMGLILGLGFPRFRGGALRYIDTVGLRAFADKAEANTEHGPLYESTDGFKARLNDNCTFY
ncbi:fatty acid oxidation complex subunit alpha FadB [Marinobacterium jannaschii]|uniref:fatty acid oxidation complex subunit alpha FadB n=1 Tax=Marinobacterium jannaschii TaxID=64970 RepID=UPI0004846081|nr:fatty acid oxidation complex subunit alpha FadB [Marinobacterium jannaschii]